MTDIPCDPFHTGYQAGLSGLDVGEMPKRYHFDSRATRRWAHGHTKGWEDRERELEAAYVEGPVEREYGAPVG